MTRILGEEEGEETSVQSSPVSTPVSDRMLQGAEGKGTLMLCLLYKLELDPAQAENGNGGKRVNKLALQFSSVCYLIG